MCRTNIVAYTHTLISVWYTFWVRSMHTHWAQTREKEDERHCTICIRTTHACYYIHIRDNECSCCAAAAAAIFRCAFTFELFVHSFTRVSLDTFISFNLSRFFPCQVNARTHTYIHTCRHHITISWCLFLYWLSCHCSSAIYVCSLLQFYFFPLFAALSKFSLSTNNVHSISHDTLTYSVIHISLSVFVSNLFGNQQDRVERLTEKHQE